MGLFDFLKSKKIESSWQDFKEQKNTINKKWGSNRSYNKNNDPKHPINNQVVMPQKFLSLFTSGGFKTTAQKRINELENEFRPYVKEKNIEIRALKSYWQNTPTIHNPQITHRAIKFYTLMEQQLEVTLNQINICIKEAEKDKTYGAVRNIFWDNNPRNPKNKKR